MRSPLRARLLRRVLLVGAVVGFGSGLHHLAHHHHDRHRAQIDGLTRVCVDAALDRGAEPVGHRERWVAQRCADHARDHDRDGATP